jgi:hypothetical protein
MSLGAGDSPGGPGVQSDTDPALPLLSPLEYLERSLGQPIGSDGDPWIPAGVDLSGSGLPLPDPMEQFLRDFGGGSSAGTGWPLPPSDLLPRFVPLAPPAGMVAIPEPSGTTLVTIGLILIFGPLLGRFVSHRTASAVLARRGSSLRELER